MNIDKLKEMWLGFKRKRTIDEYIDDKDPEFLTMIQRENIIDILFDEIQRLENEKITSCS